MGIPARCVGMDDISGCYKRKLNSQSLNYSLVNEASNRVRRNSGNYHRCVGLAEAEMLISSLSISHACWA